MGETEFEEVNPSIWKPEKDGDKIEGVLIEKKENVGVNNSMLYHIEKKDGIFGVWGSKILDDRLALIKVGEIVRITYKGKETNKKNQPVKIFKVERAKTH